VFASSLTAENILLLTKSAPLHDIGKMGIPEMILWKPGKLTKEEFEVMKTHASIGYRAIVGAERLLGTSVSFLRFAKEMSKKAQEIGQSVGSYQFPALPEAKSPPAVDSLRQNTRLIVYDFAWAGKNRKALVDKWNETVK
jgi:hypothetical protein